MVIELILLALLTLSIYLYLRTWRMRKLTRNIPTEPAYPLIGHIHVAFQVKKSADMLPLVDMFTYKYMEHGISKIWLGPLLIIPLTCPKYIEVIANSPYSKDKGWLYYSVFGDIANGLIVLSGGRRWKELKKPLLKSITKAMIVSDYLQVFVKRSNEYAEYIRQHKLGAEFDILHNMTTLTLDILSETHLGVHTNEVIENKFNFLENFHTFFECFIINTAKFLVFFNKLGERFSQVGKKIQKSKHEINKFLQWVFDERMKSDRICKGSAEYYSDFLLRSASEQNISLEDIRKELADFALAGSDTSSVVASSALLFLAMFPHIQEKAYQEQLSIFGHSKRDVTADDLESMAYLRMVIKETIRLIGVHGFIRNASEDIKLDKYTIPKGAIIYLSIQTVHQNIKYWEKPKDFYPEHFLPKKEAERPSYAYIPFGVSPRVCPGFLYGMNSIMVILSTLLRNFEVQTSMKYENIVLDYRILLHIIGGYNVKFIERSKV